MVWPRTCGFEGGEPVVYVYRVGWYATFGGTARAHITDEMDSRES